MKNTNTTIKKVLNVTLIVGVLVLATSKVNAQKAYITNYGNGTVSVVDIPTNTITDTITVGAHPSGVSVSSDGSTVYITNGTGNSVSVINTASNTVTATIPVGTGPLGIVVTPDGSMVYVANSIAGTVNVINTSTNTVTDTITVGAYPTGVSVTPDGSKVFVTNQYANTVSVITTAANIVSATIPVGNSPDGVAVSPDGSKVYVANYDDNNIKVINIATNTVLANISLGDSPYGLSVTPDGSKVYVATPSIGTVSVINTAANTVSASILIGNGAQGVSITPDGSKVYVTNTSSNTVSVINTATNSVSAAISGFNVAAAFGNFISMYPYVNCGAHYTTSYDSTLNSFTLVVDSAAAVAATAYSWDFGDGTTSTLAAPSHTYTVDTVYTVCMKIVTASGDSCQYCHTIGIDNSGNIYRTAGFTINVQNNTTVKVPCLSKETTIIIAPNPFTSQTSITFNEEQKNTSIKITDVLGKEIKTIIFTGKQLKIEKGEMKSGIYFVQITDEKKIICNKKIIIQ